MTGLPCPYGHDDRSGHGHCLAELHRILERYSREQAERAERGDASGARYSGQHVQRTWARLTALEQAEYADMVDLLADD